MKVQVKRSGRRRKTVQARMVDGVLEVAIPGHMTAAEEEHWVDVMAKRFGRGRSADAIDLGARSDQLAERFGLAPASSIMWSERQRTLWGSSTPEAGRIRISTRVAQFPDWVVDYVIVHELAHLVEPRHNELFWGLVARYPLAERARGYLIAKADAQI